MRHLLIAVPPQYLHQVREDCLWCLLPCSDPGSTWVVSRDICKMKMNSRIWKHLDWRYCIVSLLYSSAQTTIICIEREREKGWAPKNWHFWTMVLEKTLENPWDCKEIKPVNPKGNQPWILIGRTDAEAEGPILWPPDVKSSLIGKEHDAGKDWGKEKKGVTEGELHR